MRWVVALLLLCALGACSHHSVVDDSIGKLDDSGRFVTSARAAQTVADISARLRVAGAACRPQHAPRCTVVLQGAAFSAVTAYALADCTAPGVFDGRRAMLRYLRAVRTFLDGGATGAAPSVPKVVTC
ncbi:MAG TPA: hypothetical protein VHD87_07025 [Acidimicrobiales bacterium]|nr:hypothetical protein [Acidimicrobiales bacterium]